MCIFTLIFPRIDYAAQNDLPKKEHVHLQNLTAYDTSACARASSESRLVIADDGFASWSWSSVRSPLHPGRMYFRPGTLLSRYVISDSYQPE